MGKEREVPWSLRLPYGHSWVCSSTWKCLWRTSKLKGGRRAVLRFSRTSPALPWVGPLAPPFGWVTPVCPQSSRALPGTVPSAQPWSSQWILVRFPQEAVTRISPFYREETWLRRSSHCLLLHSWGPRQSGTHAGKGRRGRDSTRGLTSLHLPQKFGKTEAPAPASMGCTG